MSEPNVDRPAGRARQIEAVRLRRVVAVACVVTLLAACASSTKGEETSGDDPGSATSTDGERSATSATAPDAGATLISGVSQEGTQRLRYKYGPITIEPGQNNITFSDGEVPKPEVDGYITAIYPNLVRADSEVPRVDVLHLHHGVWVNTSGGGQDRGAFGQELFFASGEEKTTMILPKGHGYPYKASDKWLINYMLHNLLATPDEVWITYDIDFIPASSPAAADIVPARPVWMDVQKGQIYPVFDVLKGDGTDGVFTYPDDADAPYGKGERLNEWEVDRDGVLLATAGHLHPGGLHTDMFVTRGEEKAHIFQSRAIYYEPAGAVSWDVTMTATPPDWRIGVKKGDVISISATYDTTRASWYESMGIMVLWMADGEPSVDALEPGVDEVDDFITHGHLEENRNHGGEPSEDFVDATKLPSGPITDEVTIAAFTYAPGDIGGIYANVPTVKAGQRLTFYNRDVDLTKSEVWHTVTACAAPCNKATGVAYPLADAEVQFDSGELGDAGPPTAGRIDWAVPEELDEGTYTYFCRIHPSMRGAFRVAP